MENIERQLDQLQHEMGFMTLAQQIPVYEGDSKEFNEWFKSINRARQILGDSPRVGVRLALASSRKAVADYVSRYFSAHPNPNWDHFSEQLVARFGETIDQATALAKLRRMTRKPGESIQVFAERLYAMGESAYDHALLNNPVVQRELCQSFLTGCNEIRVAKAILRNQQAPQTLEQCVNIGVRELSLHNRFKNLGILPDRTGPSDPREEPMDIDMIRAAEAERYRNALSNVSDVNLRPRPSWPVSSPAPVPAPPSTPAPVPTPAPAPPPPSTTIVNHYHSTPVETAQDCTTDEPDYYDYDVDYEDYLSDDPEIDLIHSRPPSRGRGRGRGGRGHASRIPQPNDRFSRPPTQAINQSGRFQRRQYPSN